MEPGKTSFFQALGVPTKIARGTIEITTDLKLLETGNKVGPSEATLLNMLNISPFSYGMGIVQVYDQGNAFPPEVLDIGEEQLLAVFATAVTTIAAVSLAINYPTIPSVMHSLVNAYKRALAVAIESDYSWPEIDSLKDRIANPDAYAAAAPVAAEVAAGGETKEAEKEAEKEEEEESDEGGFGGLLCVTPTAACCPPPHRTCLGMKLTNLQRLNLMSGAIAAPQPSGFMCRLRSIGRSIGRIIGDWELLHRCIYWSTNHDLVIEESHISAVQTAASMK